MTHPVQGWADEGFGAVADEFARNFTERGEVGAGVAVYMAGRQVVSLWGGRAEPAGARSWEERTASVVFSCSKGITTVCLLMAVLEGRVDLDAPVTRYWPEFGAAGKESTTVRMLASHRAGLHAPRARLTLADVTAWSPVVEALARQRPWFAPGTAYQYHALTFGWLVGEVLRRATGCTPGRFLQERIAAPLGLDTWIGTPESADARFAPPLASEGGPAARVLLGLMRLRYPSLARSLTLGDAIPWRKGGPLLLGSPALRRAELPGGNAVSSAASLARLYAATVSEVDGRPRLLDDAVLTDAMRVQSEGGAWIRVPGDRVRWGTGFMLDSPPNAPMLSATSFGHDGAGGQLAFADLESRVSFAYVHNRMGGGGDQRAPALVAALARGLGRS